ncbi:MAG: hypothetical protein IJQ43_01040 [Oscillospiraceae bacterium]|nr:hypothetical protein [Oscillospiraceae bacterium]
MKAKEEGKDERLSLLLFSAVRDGGVVAAFPAHGKFLCASFSFLLHFVRGGGIMRGLSEDSAIFDEKRCFP